MNQYPCKGDKLLGIQVVLNGQVAPLRAGTTEE